jgi:hypothetical protein
VALNAIDGHLQRPDASHITPLASAKLTFTLCQMVTKLAKADGQLVKELRNGPA